jgi:hypothetical protein
VAFTQVLTMYQIYYINSPPQPFSFIPTPTLISTVVSTGIIFAFTCMCTHFIAPYSPSYPFAQYLPCSQPSSMGSTCCSTLLLSDFVGEKKRKDKMKNMTF